jgi:flagellar biosynthesis protein FlhF
MEIKTYRANSMQEAIALVRREMGPDASILHTRQAPTGLLGWLGQRQIEVTASNDLPVPSRFEQLATKPPATPTKPKLPGQPAASRPDWAGGPTAAADTVDYRAAYREALKGPNATAGSMVEKLSGTGGDSRRSWPSALNEAYQALLEGGFTHSSACDLIQRASGGNPEAVRGGVLQIVAGLQHQLAQSLAVRGPIEASHGSQRVVALVGPTGVGKTTTIAKLAAHFRLKEKLNVGLITVDTFRIAAVEQLRTYAEIIDLPMEVVGTPREMRAAVAQLAAMDLVLIDTAGRSPHDESQLQALKSMLAEAQPHETHLALSTVAGEASLKLAAQRFAPVGVDSLLLTKLDEAIGLGSLYPLLARHRLPLSYFTHGQNVPHDIRTASATKLAEAMITGYVSRPEDRS